MPSSKVCHIVAAGYEAWGHQRPLCTMCALLVKNRPFVVTYLVPRRFYDRVLAELSRSFSSGEEDARARITVIGTATDEEKPFDMDGVNNSFAEAYAKLAQLQPIKCAKTGEELVAQQIHPDAALIDLFGAQMVAAVRKYSQKYVKVYCWTTCDAASFYQMSHSFGVNKDSKARQRIEAEAERTGKSFDDVALEILRPTVGSVMRIPGLPPFYDYEMLPQNHMATMQNGEFLLSTSECFNNSDGVVFSAPTCYEPREVIETFQQYGIETGRKPYWLGPLMPAGEAGLKTEMTQSANAAEICAFMDRTLKTHGPNSMIYLSFGSIFWPAEEEKMWAFFDTLLEKGIPFIMSHASPFAKIPDAISAKAKAHSDLVYMSPWSPQQIILNHPVVGWFVTHGGFNGILESIMAAVPMICWPYGADQPINTVHMTENLGIAYELLSVRSGEGLRPLYRSGKPPCATLDDMREEVLHVLKHAFGPDGEMKRKNISRLRDRFEAAVKDDGPSRRSLNEFLDAI